MPYSPGSFTKNFGWEDNGFSKLKNAIADGFRNELLSVERNVWRVGCGVEYFNQALIPLNFFLHNSNGNISIDELVFRAVARPYSLSFSRLALYAFHLSQVGNYGRNVARPALWSNRFVREILWTPDGWRNDRLNNDTLRPYIYEQIEGVQRTKHKCFTNYRHFWRLAGYWDAGEAGMINAVADDWLASALFLTWDRHLIDGGDSDLDALTRVLREEEIHKLLGTSEELLLDAVGEVFDRYRGLGTIERFADIAIAENPIVGMQAMLQAEDDVVVERRLRQFRAQVRDRRNAANVKARYDNTCLFCGERLQVGVDRHYCEAAHIKALGEPHNGPDIEENIIPLCPNHHLQFDRGVLSIQRRNGEYRLLSKLPNDALHNKILEVRHEIGEEYINWHHNWFAN